VEVDDVDDGAPAVEEPLTQEPHHELLPETTPALQPHVESDPQSEPPATHTEDHPDTTTTTTTTTTSPLQEEPAPDESGTQPEPSLVEPQGEAPRDNQEEATQILETPSPEPQEEQQHDNAHHPQPDQQPSSSTSPLSGTADESSESSFPSTEDTSNTNNSTPPQAQGDTANTTVEEVHTVLTEKTDEDWDNDDHGKENQTEPTNDNDEIPTPALPALPDFSENTKKDPVASLWGPDHDPLSLDLDFGALKDKSIPANGGKSTTEETEKPKEDAPKKDGFGFNTTKTADDLFSQDTDDLFS